MNATLSRSTHIIFLQNQSVHKCILILTFFVPAVTVFSNGWRGLEDVVRRVRRVTSCDTYLKGSKSASCRADLENLHDADSSLPALGLT